jgi:hypothetical protein
MDEIERREKIPPQARLSKQGITAFFCAAGGVFLFILQIISKFRVLGLIAGAVVCAVGIGALLSKDAQDHKPGAVIIAAGALAILSKVPVIAPLAGTLLSIGAFGLLVLGVWNGIKFFAGLKKRS